MGQVVWKWHLLIYISCYRSGFGRGGYGMGGGNGKGIVTCYDETQCVGGPCKCAEWKNAGACDTHVFKMMINCRKTCGFC